MNILILTGRFGAGHCSAARALRQQLLASVPNIEVQVVDFFSYALFERNENKQEVGEEILRLILGKKPGRRLDAASVGAEKIPYPSPHGRWKSARRLSRQLTPQALDVCRRELGGGESWMAPPKRSLLDMLPI